MVVKKKKKFRIEQIGDLMISDKSRLSFSTISNISSDKTRIKTDKYNVRVICMIYMD